MTGGFTFDGVDIADLDLEYAPELNNTYIYKPAGFKLHEQTFDGHDGGFYYGSSVQPKDFTLRCFYEGKHVMSGAMTKIYNVFKRNKTGRLIFKKRPWCWYVATVTNINIDQMFNYENGVVTITMRAYYPFARTDYMTIPYGCEYEEDMLKNSALVPTLGDAYSTVFATSNNPIRGQTTLSIHNPGTERAKAIIRIAGDVGGGVTISNATTEQNCKYVAITHRLCEDNFYIQTDSLNGQTIKTDGTRSYPGFLYHDNGFIELDPGFPAYRDVPVRMEDNEHTVYSDHKFTEDMLGRAIYFNDGSFSFIDSVVSDSEVHIEQSILPTGGTTVNILKSNKIFIYPEDSINLTKFEILFRPTFA